MKEVLQGVTRTHLLLMLIFLNEHFYFWLHLYKVENIIMAIFLFNKLAIEFVSTT